MKPFENWVFLHLLYLKNEAQINKNNYEAILFMLKHVSLPKISLMLQKMKSSPKSYITVSFLSYFFVKKILLSQRVGYVMDGWFSGSWFSAISFPEPCSPWPAVGKRELWEQPFWNSKGNNQILPIRFHAVCIYGTCLKWFLLELSIPAAGQKNEGGLVWNC